MDRNQSMPNSTEIRAPGSEAAGFAGTHTRCAFLIVVTLSLFFAACGCSRQKDPLLEILLARTEYDVQLKGFAPKLDETGEISGQMLDLFVINNSDLTLDSLTVKVMHFGVHQSADDVPMAFERVTLDVSRIATNRSSQLTVTVTDLEPGPEDSLAVMVEGNPPADEYDQFTELVGVVNSSGHD